MGSIPCRCTYPTSSGMGRCNLPTVVVTSRRKYSRYAPRNGSPQEKVGKKGSSTDPEPLLSNQHVCATEQLLPVVKILTFAISLLAPEVPALRGWLRVYLLRHDNKLYGDMHKVRVSLTAAFRAGYLKCPLAHTHASQETTFRRVSVPIGVVHDFDVK